MPLADPHSPLTTGGGVGEIVAVGFGVVVGTIVAVGFGVVVGTMVPVGWGVTVGTIVPVGWGVDVGKMVPVGTGVDVGEMVMVGTGVCVGSLPITPTGFSPDSALTTSRLEASFRDTLNSFWVHPIMESEPITINFNVKLWKAIIKNTPYHAIESCKGQTTL